MKNLPKISSSLCLDSKNKSLLNLENMIGISPTYIRDIEDWPDVIKQDKELSEELQCYEWNLIYEEIKCKDINIPLSRLRKDLEEKASLLKKLAQENQWNITIVIRIDEYQTDKADIDLTPEIINFAAMLNCCINFDINQY